MKLLEHILNVTLYKIPCKRNFTIDALTKLTKELSYLDVDFIFIELQAHEIMLPIYLE